VNIAISSPLQALTERLLRKVPREASRAG